MPQSNREMSSIATNISDHQMSQLELSNSREREDDGQVSSGNQDQSIFQGDTKPHGESDRTSAKMSQSEIQNSPSQSRVSNNASLNVERRHISASRDSSMNDDPRSLVDSLSASSSRHMWVCKDPCDDDASISPIRGDSISATIANFNNKHGSAAQPPVDIKPSNETYSQVASNDSIRPGLNSSKTNDDTSSKLNFYPACSSTSGSILHQDSQSQTNKQVDFVSVSSAANVDAFDIIEESSSLSSSEAVLRRSMMTNDQASCDRIRDGSCAESSDGVIDQRPNKSLRARPRDRRNMRRRANNSNLLERALEIYDMPPDAAAYQVEPVVLRGNGNLTLFGLSNSFSDEFPASLIGRVSKEEFEKTMRRINNLLRDQQSLSAKLLLFGGLCCCCSLGFSLVWPSIALKKRSKMSLEKFLANENNRLYTKLGLNWKLSEQRCYSNPAFVEYVLMIEFIPKINLYLPD